MLSKSPTLLLLFVVFLMACDGPKENTGQNQAAQSVEPTNRVLLSSDIIWEKLNPARGDQSPQAGTIWGDRNGSEATGFLAKFVDGFSSPPHIHNVTYRAVVIKGNIHNDDPQAENMWMKPGSFWTQPAGEVHITSAKGAENIALVEIDKSPYLVKPANQAFDNGERPVNIDASNAVWLDNSRTNWIETDDETAISFLWEDAPNKGLFIKLPVAFKGEIENNGTVLHAVVINGNLAYTLPQNKEVKTLDAGSYFGASDKALHTISTIGEEECLLYIRTNGVLKIK